MPLQTNLIKEIRPLFASWKIGKTRLLDAKYRPGNELVGDGFFSRQGEAYSLRWFTSEAEVDLCGHATLASAHILWEEQLFKGDEIRFMTKSGILTAIKDGNWIRMNFPLETEQKSVPPVELCFYPAVGVNENPVTGSAYCCLGPYWRDKLNKNELTALQLSTRTGLLKLTVLKERILISGHAITTLKGELSAE